MKKPKQKMFAVPLVDAVSIEAYHHPIYHMLSGGPDHENPSVAEITNYRVSMRLQNAPDTHTERRAIEDKIRKAVKHAQDAEPFLRLPRHSEGTLPEQHYYESGDGVHVDWQQSPPQVVIEPIMSLTMLNALFDTGLMATNLDIAAAFSGAARNEKRGKRKQQLTELDESFSGESSVSSHHVCVQLLEPALDSAGKPMLGDLSGVRTLDDGVVQLRHALSSGAITTENLQPAILMLASAVKTLPAPVDAAGASNDMIVADAPDPSLRTRVEYILHGLAGDGRQLAPELPEGEHYGHVAGEQEPVALSTLQQELHRSLEERSRQGIPSDVYDMRAYEISDGKNVATYYQGWKSPLSDDDYVALRRDHREMVGDVWALTPQQEEGERKLCEKWGITPKEGRFDIMNMVPGWLAESDTPEQAMLDHMQEKADSQQRKEATGSMRASYIYLGAKLLKPYQGGERASLFAGMFNELSDEACLIAYFFNKRTDEAYASLKERRMACFGGKTSRLEFSPEELDEVMPKARVFDVQMLAFSHAKDAKFAMILERDTEQKQVQPEDDGTITIPPDIQAQIDQFYDAACQDAKAMIGTALTPLTSGASLAVLHENDRAYIGNMRYKVYPPRRNDEILYDDGVAWVDRKPEIYETINPGFSNPRPIPEPLQALLDAKRSASQQADRGEEPARLGRF